MISTPGIHSLSMAEYQADPCPEPSLSSGIAKLLITRSPLHAWIEHPRLNPAYQEREDSRFDLGSATHSMLLEGADICVPLEYEDWRTKEARARRDEIRAAGRIPLLQEQYQRARAMSETALLAIERCPDLAGYHLHDCLIEQSFIWQDGLGCWCRARPDAVSRDRKLMIDYKTTAASANPAQWVRTALGMQAEVQAAFYLRGNLLLGGPEDAKFIFIVQENEPPFAVSFCGVSPAMLDMARGKVNQAIYEWTRCLRDGKWPSYPSRVHWLEPPAYALAAWDEQQMMQELGKEYDPAQLFGDNSK